MAEEKKQPVSVGILEALKSKKGTVVGVGLVIVATAPEPITKIVAGAVVGVYLIVQGIVDAVKASKAEKEASGKG